MDIERFLNEAEKTSTYLSDLNKIAARKDMWIEVHLSANEGCLKYDLMSNQNNEVVLECSEHNLYDFSESVFRTVDEENWRKWFLSR